MFRTIFAFALVCSAAAVTICVHDPKICDGSYVGTELDLRYTGLTGSVPPQIGLLTNLTELYLFGNDLTGSVPSQIGLLTKLKSLDLSENGLTGTLPSQLKNLNSLNTCYLSYTSSMFPPTPATNKFDCPLPENLPAVCKSDPRTSNANYFECSPVDPGSNGDPHLIFADGGKADFRGQNDTHFVMLSAPGMHFGARTMVTDFRLPTVQLVHGTFFTDAVWVVRGLSKRLYAIVSSASKIGFDVLDANQPTTVVAQRKGVWQSWKEDGILAFYKQQTIYVRANGWEVNATREPIYNMIRGPSSWRFDLAMRKLDGTRFAKEFGNSSASCFPHGIIGQSYDGDNMAVSGKTDDYTNRVEVTTTAMAEGAIEGSATDYALSTPFETGFKYSRFAKIGSDECAPRDVSKLKGFTTKGNTEATSSSKEDDTAVPVKQE